ncbi:hypothetical protein BaRGS_00026949 [Batillaria attramentaria]|uniref:FAM69 protein-kinase domain-containing protein n=1 Tax=Batillaria attramentaria TaxID=370345 RepID=A0ABD0K4Q1_9CAEN
MFVCVCLLLYVPLVPQCQLYKSGVVTGDLCFPLCDQGLIQLTDCSGLSFQKKVVKVNCTDVCQDELTVTAFLKTDVINVTKILHEIPNWRGTRDSTDDFQQAVSQLIVKYVKQYLSFLSFNEGEAFLQLEEADATWRSVSLLMRQSEYVLAKVFEDRKVFPRVYGSCGHFYLQESCPPPKWSKVIPGPEFEHLEEREASWVGRAYGALRTLQFLQHLETTLPDHLIGCDLKPSNFGMCPDGALRMIDINNVYFNSSMTPHIRRNVPCTEDRQCVYMWVMCEGKCDVSTGTCYMENNINLEFTCRGVFMDIENMKNPQTSLDGHGRLLKDPPPAVASDLYRVLNECASLTEILAHEPGARQRVMEQLMSVLQQSLDQASR